MRQFDPQLLLRLAGVDSIPRLRWVLHVVVLGCDVRFLETLGILSCKARFYNRLVNQLLGNLGVLMDIGVICVGFQSSGHVGKLRGGLGLGQIRLAGLEVLYWC